MIPRRLLIAVAVLAFAAAWPFMSDFTVTVVSNIGLFSLVAIGLVLLTGIAGMTSFGQAAFVGLAAYTTGLVSTSPGFAAGIGLAPDSALLPWLGLLLGLVVTGLVSWILGLVTLRLSGHYLPLCTIAWGLSLYFLFGNLDFLGGHTGMGGLPALSLPGIDLSDSRAMGVLIWVFVLAAVWASSNLLDSRPGRAIRALKTGRVMAEAMGIPTGRFRIKIFVFAALLACLSGWLYAHMQRFLNPTPFNINISIEYLFMAVIGGAGHLWGAILGTTLITMLKQYLQDVLPQLLGATGNFEIIVFGVLMLLVLQRFPDGLWPTLARWSSRLVRAGTGAAIATAARKAGEVAANQSAALKPSSTATPHHAGEVVLDARQITRRFGGLVANNQVDLDVRAGEIHALIGPNGAGKSTFFNMISGVDQPTEGRVSVAGQDMTGRPSRDYAARGLGRTFQHVRLLGQRSVLENVALGAHRQGRRGWLAAMLRLDRREEEALLATAAEQIARCGLADHLLTPAASLALGQQRIVEIARALAGSPRILLLDEPAAGLRHLEKRALAALLDQLRAAGMAILVVEHDMEFVMNVADRITVLEFGRVISTGTPAQVQADPVVLEAYLGGAPEQEVAA